MIKEDQDLQGLGMKWIGENQVLNCNVGFVNKRVTIGENVLTEGSLLTQPLNDIVSSSSKFNYLNESFFLTLNMNIELFPYNVIQMSCNKLMKLFK